MHIEHLKFINHNKPECRIIWMDFRCWFQVQVKEKMTFTFSAEGFDVVLSIPRLTAGTLYNNLPLSCPLCKIIWYVCLVYFPSLLWLFSFSHRCKFFSLTETPENYTVVLDEEGFKGKTHTYTHELLSWGSSLFIYDPGPGNCVLYINWKLNT